ncbi:hypothetical protein LEMLEM_LOCUS6918 [Lemmus lemmus]
MRSEGFLGEVYADNSQKQESHSGTSGERLISTRGTVLPSREKDVTKLTSKNMAFLLLQTKLFPTCGSGLQSEDWTFYTNSFILHIKKLRSKLEMLAI